MLPIPGFPGYFAAKNGEVWSFVKPSSPIVLKPWCRRGKYLYVDLCVNRQKFHKRVGRLILESFVGPCPDGMECSHLNGNPKDNRLFNLAWKTHVDNEADKLVHGTRNGPKGEVNVQAKITERMANRIWAELKTDKSTPRSSVYRRIADSLGVTVHIVKFIDIGRTWKHCYKKWDKEQRKQRRSTD